MSGTPSEDANLKLAAARAKQRAAEEAQELKAKLDRLSTFINGPGYYGVSDHQKGLLRAQYSHMVAYHATLQQRLRNWEL